MSLAYSEDDIFASRVAALPPFTPPRVPLAGEKPSFPTFFRTVANNPVAATPEAMLSGRSRLYDWPWAQVIFINEPDAVEEVMLRRRKNFPKSWVDRKFFGSAADKGILIADSEDWKWRRKLAAPYFQPKALARLIPAMSEPFNDLVEEWRTRPAGTRVMGADAMLDATFNMVIGTLFAPEERHLVAHFPAALAEYLEPFPWIVGTGMLKLPHWLPYPGRRQFLDGIVKMRRYMEEAIAYRRAHNITRNDLTTDLLNACDVDTGQKFTDVDIVDMLMTMIAAGHETTAHALTWMLYNLAKQPELQTILADEVAHATGGGPINSDNLQSMIHLDAFIKESMRVLPSVPLLTRRAANATELAGYRLRKDAVIFIPIYAIQHHCDLWTEPDRFDHTRFLRGEASTLSRTAYMPFGAGPRVCIGNIFAMMEMTIGLATLLQNVRIRPDAETDNFEFLHLLTLKPSNGLPLQVEFVSPA